MWPFKKKEPEVDYAAEGLKERQRIEQERAEALAYLQEKLPIGTEFVLLGVRFRVYGYTWHPRVKANYINGKGELDDADFDIDEVKSFFEEATQIEVGTKK